MVLSAPTDFPPSLLPITLRRSMLNGRAYLIYASGVSLFLGVSLSFSSGSAFESGFPIFLPIFAVVGSMGGLMVFTSDRLKGVLEYLLAYGVSPRRLFFEVLLSSLVLASVVLAVAVGGGLGVYLARGNPLTVPLLALLGVYAIPMGYASTALAATVGMFWTTLSSPREGMNSPIGLAPLIGILPPLATVGAFVALGLRGAVSPFDFLLVASIAIAAVGLLVLMLIGLAARLLRLERLLSPA